MRSKTDDVPLVFQFSGTIFYAAPDGAMRIAQIGWDKEARFRLPARVWREMMDLYYPNSAWLRLRRDTFDRLHDYKQAAGDSHLGSRRSRALLPADEPGKAGGIVNCEPLEKIANAVLYEGFLLYPYRKSSVKNQQRWHFGTLGPAGGSDPSMMQTQCLVEGYAADRVRIKIRFLQEEIEREVELSALAGRSEFAFPPIAFAVEVESDRLAG